jgi:hypothetical protein
VALVDPFNMTESEVDPKLKAELSGGIAAAAAAAAPAGRPPVSGGVAMPGIGLGALVGGLGALKVCFSSL